MVFCSHVVGFCTVTSAESLSRLNLSRGQTARRHLQYRQLRRRCTSPPDFKVYRYLRKALCSTCNPAVELYVKEKPRATAQGLWLRNRTTSGNTSNLGSPDYCGVIVIGALPIAVTPWLLVHTAVTTYCPGAVPAPNTAELPFDSTGVIAFGGTPVAFHTHCLMWLYR